MGSRFLVSFIALLGGFLMLYLGAWGQWRQFHELRRETARVEAASSQQEKVAQELRALKEEMNARSEDVSKVRRLFIDGGNVEDAIRIVESLSSTYGLAVVDIKMGQKHARQGSTARPRPTSAPQAGAQASQEGVETIQVIPVSVRLAGRYENFKTLLAGVAQTLPLAGVPLLSVAPPLKAEETLFLFDVTFEFFTLE